MDPSQSEDISSSLELIEKGKSLYQKANYNELLQLMNEGIPSIKNNNNILAELYFLRGRAYYKKGKFSTATDGLHKALELLDNNKDHPLQVKIYIALCEVSRQDYRLPEAVSYAEKALNIALKIFKEDDIELARAYHEMAGACIANSQYQESIEYSKKSLEIKRKYTWKDQLLELGYSELRIGVAHLKRRDPIAAGAALAIAEQCMKQYYQEDHPDLGDLYMRMGELHDLERLHTTAISTYERSLEQYLKFYGENHPSVAILYLCMGYAYFNNKNYGLALEFFAKCKKIAKKFYSENNVEVLNIDFNIGNVYFGLEAYDQALVHYLKPVKGWMESLGIKHLSMSKIHNNLGLLANRVNYEKMSSDNWKKVFTLYKNIIKDNKTELLRFRLWIGAQDIRRVLSTFEYEVTV